MYKFKQNISEVLRISDYFIVKKFQFLKITFKITFKDVSVTVLKMLQTLKP